MLNAKIDKRKKQNHPAHDRRFNHDLQLEIDKYKNRLKAVIRAMIRDLEKRKDKAMKRQDTDDFWNKIESLHWVLFVIFATKNGKMVVI